MTLRSRQCADLLIFTVANTWICLSCKQTVSLLSGLDDSCLPSNRRVFLPSHWPVIAKKQRRVTCLFFSVRRNHSRCAEEHWLRWRHPGHCERRPDRRRQERVSCSAGLQDAGVNELALQHPSLLQVLFKIFGLFKIIRCALVPNRLYCKQRSSRV